MGSDPQEPRGLMTVKTDVVREVLVGRILDRVAAHAHDVLPEAVERALADGLAPHERAPTELEKSLVRDGYLLRIAEAELFEPARAPAERLAGDVARWLVRTAEPADAIAEAARELAAFEPLARPDPGDERAASWRVPGPGGHVRHEVAREAITRRLDAGELPPEGDPGALKRHLMFGFFLRCCEEAEVAPG